MMAITTRKIEKWVKKGKVDKLIMALKEDDDRVRHWAIKSLGEIGDAKAADALVTLVRTLGYERLYLQADAFEALVKIGPAAVAPLIKALEDTDTVFCSRAAKALTEIGVTAVDQLIKALRDDSGSVRLYAVQALYVIQDPKSVESLIKVMEDDEAFVRKCAVKAMCKIGTPKAVAPLIKALADSNKEVRTYAGDALERIGKSAVDSLIKALDDKQRIVRESAVNILDRLEWKPAKDETGVKYYIVKANLEEYVDISTPAVGHDTKAQGDDGKNLLKRVVDTLIIMLDHKLRSVRQEAAAILDKLGWKPAKDETGLKYHIVKANLEKYIDIGSPPIGRDIKTQGNDGKDILQKTIESSIKTLDEKQKSIRKKGAGILYKLGWRPTMDETGAKYYIAKGNIGKCIEIGTAAVDPLIKELEDKNEDVRSEAVNTLGKIGDAKAAEPLVRALGDKNYGVCDDSVAALVKVGAPAVEPLIKALAGDGKEIQKRAIEVLGKIGDTRAVEPLVKALENVEIDIRIKAAWTLGAIGDARAVDPLIRALGDNSREVVICVSRALNNFYKSGNLSQEKKKAILELDGKKIAHHYDYNQPPPLDCDLPPRHTDSPAIHFNL